MTNPNGPFSFSSPMSGMVTGEVVSINSPDNSVQVRLHGYQDDRGNIPDEKLEWLKVLGNHSGIQGATGTHNMYPGAKVMVSMSGAEKFVVGSITGYDSDKRKDGADDSDSTDPNTPRQVRGPQGPGNRTVPAGEGSDQTSKGTRSVTKTDKQFDREQPEKVYDYAKHKAPFDKGDQSKFPDLKSIGIDKLSQGSNVLDVIDSMDGNVSGAIQAGTKIIRNMERSGFGDALSMMNGGGGSGGGAADQATAQVAAYHGNIQLGDLVAALRDLLKSKALLDSTAAGPADLSPLPHSLTYQVFAVGLDLQSAVQDGVNQVAASSDPIPLVKLRSDFSQAFFQAVSAAMTYVDSMVNRGSIASLVIGAPSVDAVQSLLSSLQAGASAAGMPASAVPSLGGGSIGQLIQQGQAAIGSVLNQAQGVIGQVQKMIQDLNTFSPEVNALSEIMGGGASIQESLTNITMKFSKKRINLDLKGFTK